MANRVLTENSWKTIASKFKVEDNGLQKALAIYERLADDKHADRLKALASVMQLAGNLKRVNEAAAVREIIKYPTSAPRWRSRK